MIQLFVLLAFPAIGCGQFNFDPMLIARSMLLATRDQLKTLKSKIKVSFVLLPEQRNVYDAFVQCVNEIEAIDLNVTAKLPMTKKDDRLSLPFDRKSKFSKNENSRLISFPFFLAVKITLIGSNDHDLIKCKDEIHRLVDTYFTKTRQNRPQLLDWPQNVIEKYYVYCLKLRVIPAIDFDNETLELMGTKDAVVLCCCFSRIETSAMFRYMKLRNISLN